MQLYTRQPLPPPTEQSAPAKTAAKFSTPTAGAKRSLADANVDDIILYRFLKANDFDVDGGLKQLHAALAFRALHGCDAIRARVRAEKMLQPQWPHAAAYALAFPARLVHGTDKDSQPLSTERLGTQRECLLWQFFALLFSASAFLLYFSLTHCCSVRHEGSDAKQTQSKLTRIFSHNVSLLFSLQAAPTRLCC
jgi:hypothetical protein